MALNGEKILVTGPAGQIAFPLARYLAANNEVWGIARFSDAGSRDRVEAAGVTTRVVDLGDADFSELPDDFTYVLHLAAYLSPGRDYDAAIRVNAEGTGFLLQHCRNARAVLVMSTASVYKPNPDPWHAYLETDPLGDTNLPHIPTYSMSKIAQEAVARWCARAMELPVVIARMNAAYGPNGGLPSMHLDALVAQRHLPLRWDPLPYSPIHEDDINDQVEALLGAASVPATIVNWGGDEPVTAQDWCAYLGELTGLTPDLGVKPVPGAPPGLVLDATKRSAITGPCKVQWRDGVRAMVEARFPEGTS